MSKVINCVLTLYQPADVKKVDNDMYQPTSVCEGSTSLVVNTHDYQLKFPVEQHGEIINRGHHAELVEG